MLAIMGELFGARYVTYEAGESRESEFSVLLLPLLKRALSGRVHHVIKYVSLYVSAKATRNS